MTGAIGQLDGGAGVVIAMAEAVGMRLSISGLKETIERLLWKLLLKMAVRIHARMVKGGEGWPLVQGIFLTASGTELLCLANMCEAVAYVARSELNVRLRSSSPL